MKILRPSNTSNVPMRSKCLAKHAVIYEIEDHEFRFFSFKLSAASCWHQCFFTPKLSLAKVRLSVITFYSVWSAQLIAPSCTSYPVVRTDRQSQPGHLFTASCDRPMLVCADSNIEFSFVYERKLHALISKHTLDIKSLQMRQAASGPFLNGCTRAYTTLSVCFPFSF